MLTTKPLLNSDHELLSIDRSLLIVTDIQGKLAEIMANREELFNNVISMIEGAKILGVPILWVEQYPEGLGPTRPEIAEHLEGLEPMAKMTFSSLRNEAIKKRFEEFDRDQIIITGIETHICIHQTSMDILASGRQAYVVADAVSSRTSFNKLIGLNKLAKAGAIITSMETVLFELLGEAGGDKFKEILKLVK